MDQVHHHTAGRAQGPMAAPLRLSDKSAVDESGAGAMFVIDGQRRILFGNDRAIEMLQSMAIVYACSDRLTFSDEARDAAFASHLRQIALGRIREVSLAAADERYAVSIVAMTSPTLADGATPAPPRVLTIRFETAPGASPPIAAIAEDHAITPAESRVLDLVSRGLNAVEIARALGIAASTVRTHLQRLFQKTQTTRQTELVRFVATYGVHARM